MLAQLFIFLIRVYQWTLAPLFGNVCRFEPSCSRYAIECIRIHGPFVGLWLGFRRVLRCHPFNPGGHDPPPLRRRQSTKGETTPLSSCESLRVNERVHHAVDCTEVL
jgi:uncharacterized protein